MNKLYLFEHLTFTQQMDARARHDIAGNNDGYAYRVNPDGSLGERSSLPSPCYVCEWDLSVFPSRSRAERLVEEPSENYFTNDRGYDSTDRLQIGNLAIGDTWLSPDHGPAHCVRRVS